MAHAKLRYSDVTAMTKYRIVIHIGDLHALKFVRKKIVGVFNDFKHVCYSESRNTFMHLVIIIIIIIIITTTMFMVLSS